MFLEANKLAHTLNYYTLFFAVTDLRFAVASMALCNVHFSQ